MLKMMGSVPMAMIWKAMVQYASIVGLLPLLMIQSFRGVRSVRLRRIGESSITVCQRNILMVFRSFIFLVPCDQLPRLSGMAFVVPEGQKCII
jgi:hypothetical protein